MFSGKKKGRRESTRKKRVQDYPGAKNPPDQPGRGKSGRKQEGDLKHAQAGAGKGPKVRRTSKKNQDSRTGGESKKKVSRKKTQRKQAQSQKVQTPRKKKKAPVNLM